MDLSVMERLLLLELLPAEGSITTLRIVRDLRSALSFTEQEHADWHIEQQGGQVRWDTVAAQLTPIAIGPTASALIRAALEKRNTAQTLRAEHVDLWDRFVVEDTAPLAFPTRSATSAG